MSAIEVSALQKSYGQLRAVDEISFSVNQGEVFSLLGPNGAGKTTTIEILEGIRQRDGGNVRVLGVDPWTSGYALHKKLGIIPQGFTFFPKAKPKEAIQYYADLFGVTVDSSEILRKVVLDDAVNTYFEDLSGGQKQKVGLALSLVNNPEMLFVNVRIHEKHDILVALESMEASGLDWTDLKTRKDSLEDVFIKLVGFAIEEGGGIKQVDRAHRGA